MAPKMDRNDVTTDARFDGRLESIISRSREKRWSSRPTGVSSKKPCGRLERWDVGRLGRGWVGTLMGWDVGRSVGRVG